MLPWWTPIHVPGIRITPESTTQVASQATPLNLLKGVVCKTTIQTSLYHGRPFSYATTFTYSPPHLHTCKTEVVWSITCTTKCWVISFYSHKLCTVNLAVIFKGEPQGSPHKTGMVVTSDKTTKAWATRIIQPFKIQQFQLQQCN